MKEIIIDGIKYYPQKDIHDLKVEVEEKEKCIKEEVEKRLDELKKDLLNKVTHEPLASFSFHSEKKIINSLSRIFSLKDEYMSEFTAKKQDFISVMDAANVAAIKSKSDRAKNVLRRFVEENNDRFPDIDYSDKSLTTNNTKYSIEYLNRIINFFTMSSEESSVYIDLKKDFPIKLENDDFIILLAPRLNT